MVINFAQSRGLFYFCASSQKFRILLIPNLLAHGKSYEHGFMKKYDGHKLCTKSRFNHFSDIFLRIVSEI
ncbi:hypothetical protein BHM03_00019287 [Ensete ventricosum]|nr:hypothetical protein BHM03_00019287 [Ensete ventricosum]